MGTGSGGAVRRRVRVHGRVQGVFFRASLERLARERDIAGSARNLDDGSLEAIFEGSRDAVDGIVAFCSQGPEGAEVSRVDLTEEEPQGAKGFDTG